MKSIVKKKENKNYFLKVKLILGLLDFIFLPLKKNLYCVMKFVNDKIETRF